MKSILISSIIFVNLLYSNVQNNNILNLTPKDIKFIKASPKKGEIVKRLKSYKEFKEDILKNKDQYSPYKQLSRTNSFFNNILSKNDEESDIGDDHWATRKEFLFKGYGDCEDYAISKYFTLKDIGFDPKKLYMMVVQVKGRLTYHMVLGYFPTKDSTPLILDNLSFKVVPLDKRKDLEVLYIFNEYSDYLMKNNKLFKRTKINWQGNNKWKKLLYRIYKNKE